MESTIFNKIDFFDNWIFPTFLLRQKPDIMHIQISFNKDITKFQQYKNVYIDLNKNLIIPKNISEIVEYFKFSDWKKKWYDNIKNKKYIKFSILIGNQDTVKNYYKNDKNIRKFKFNLDNLNYYEIINVEDNILLNINIDFY